MQVVVADYNPSKFSDVGPWSELHGKNGGRDYLEYNGEDNNCVTFCYHYKEGHGITAGMNTTDDQYQKPEIFQKQVALASEHFKDKDFQFITFNVAEQKRFGSLMKGLGFKLYGNAKGRSDTPIYLYIKAKK